MSENFLNFWDHLKTIYLNSALKDQNNFLTNNLLTEGSNLDLTLIGCRNLQKKVRKIYFRKFLYFFDIFLFKFQHPYLRLIVCYFVILCNFLVFAEDPVSHSKRGEQKTFSSLTFSSSQFYTLLHMYLKVVSKVPRNFNYIPYSFIQLYHHMILSQCDWVFDLLPIFW